MNTRSEEQLVIGLVGGIGAGKSTVATEFGKLGCVVVDGDAIAHELLGRADVQQQIRRRWGAEVFNADGQVDRPALGAVVFGDPAELAALSAILHPLIRGEVARQIAEAAHRPDVPAVVLDAAVLFEAGWDDLCTHTVFVDAPLQVRQERASRQRGWDEATFAARENAQIDVDKKAKMCDDIFSNCPSDPPLGRTVPQLLDRLADPSDRQ